MDKKNIQTRLKKIEGQIKGIEKMIDKEADCREVLIQIAAVRSAINKAGSIILENYAKDCFGQNCSQEEIKKIEDIANTLSMFMK